MSDSSNKMWGGRFAEGPDAIMTAINASIGFDKRLAAQDIAGSRAHAAMLAACDIISDSDAEAIREGLLTVLSEIEGGEFAFSEALEDIHMNLEAELTRRIGPAGAKLHTARSRNDQVATDTRLYCRAEIDLLDAAVAELQRALLDRAERYATTVLPAYTHLQRGQPVTVGHHLLAYVEMLGRDRSRLADCRRRLNRSPLGSGALAGSTINLDRRAIATELGFDDVTRNSMDAVADRDYIAEVIFVVGLCGVHLSRLSEDLVLWTSAEFGFVTLSDAHTTGSSLMPQKKNPDVCEITRGKTGRLLGNLVAILTAIKGLPLTYNRDLQEDKEPLFDSIDTLKLTLAVNAEMIGAMEFREERCREAAADPMLLATDLADWLVQQGVPFRHAHELVGKAVAEALRTGTPLDRLDLPKIDPAFTAEAASVFSLERALAARTNPGAPSPDNVRAEIARWQAELSK